MNVTIGPRLAASAVALLLSAGWAQAQEPTITAAEADAYIRQIQQEATDIMRAQDLGRLGDWIDRNIADGAVWQATLVISRNGERKGFADVSLKKDDIRRMGGVFAGAFQKQAIDDYALEAVVTKVPPHGPGAATVSVRWTERLRTGQDGNQQLAIEAVSDCRHLLQRAEGHLALGLTSCTSEVRF